MKNRLITLVLLAFGSMAALAAVLPSASTVLRSVTTADGLSDMLVNVICRDSVGYVWFGTGVSVDRFDGSSLVSYPLPGDDHRRKRVTAIATTDGIMVYASNGDGLWRINQQQGRAERVYEREIDFAVHDLAAYCGLLFAATENGLYVCRPSDGSVYSYRIDDNPYSKANRLTSVTVAADSTVWAAGSSALYSLSIGDDMLAAHLVTTGSFIRNLEAVGGQVYVGTDGSGLWRYNPVSNGFAPFAIDGSAIVSSLSSNGVDHLYVATDGSGIYCVSVPDGKVVGLLSHDRSSSPRLRSNSVYAFMVDSAGLMWVGYYQDGVEYSMGHRDLFDVYRNMPLIDTSDMAVRSILIDEDLMLIGTREGLYCYDMARNRSVHHAMPRIAANFIFSICKWRDRCYFGTYGGGLYSLNPNTFEAEAVTLPDLPERSGTVFALEPDAAGNLWVGTSAGLVRITPDGEQQLYTSDNSRLPEGNVYCVYFDSNATGWIGTESGMCLFDGSSLRDDVFPKGFCNSEKIRDIYEDSHGTLWFMPDRGPLMKSDKRMKEFSWHQPPGLYDSYMGAFVVEDGSGGMWYGSSNGLSREDREGNFWRFSFSDGLPNPSFTLCKPVRDNKGDLWLGNNAGLLRFKASDIEQLEQHTATVTITEMIRRGDRNLTVKVSDFSYSSPDDMLFEYMLEGLDTRWHFMNGKSDINLYDIPAGRYTLRVRSLGKLDSETQTVVTFGGGSGWLWPSLAVAAMILAVSIYVVHWLKARGNEREAAEAAEAEAEAAAADERKYKANRFNDSDCEALYKRLLNLMERERPYTNPELSLVDLAVKLDEKPHTLSYLFNVYLNSNYYDFVNEYRINLFKSIVASDEKERYTLTALSEMCGFSSRTTFFRYFKKRTGISPKEYVTGLKSNVTDE